jgi:hypothetical protein
MIILLQLAYHVPKIVFIVIQLTAPLVLLIIFIHNSHPHVKFVIYLFVLLAQMLLIAQIAFLVHIIIKEYAFYVIILIAPPVIIKAHVLIVLLHISFQSPQLALVLVCQIV